MWRTTLLTGLATALMLAIGAGVTPAQSIAPVYDQDDYDRAKVDRYLDVEVWTSNSDGEFYDGDNIVIYFRASRDAFVAIYSIDTRGRVDLLFPTYPGEDNFINGGVTYSLPGGKDDYDLVVSGPEGFENIQVIASREKFPIPDWYSGPELVVNDGEDRDDYMDWVNTNYFVDYGGQRFAYDRAVVYVNEWEPDYFRPVYYPSYPSWTIYGNCYIDYPWGASVYINGIYWGCVPLYIPHIAVGWHTITIYDEWNHCWEHDFHVSHYNTIVFNRTIIHTSPEIKSKYKEVRTAGYRDPVRNGYPNFEQRKTAMVNSFKESGRMSSKSGQKVGADDFDMDNAPKKFVRGSTKVVKTDRGFETDASNAVFPEKGGKLGSTNRDRGTSNYEGTKSTYEGAGSTQRKVTGGHSRGTSNNSGTFEGTSGKGRSSGTSDKPGSGGRGIEKPSSSGKSGSSVKQADPPRHQPKAVEPSGDRGSKPDNSSGSSKGKSSDGGSSIGSSKGGSSGGGSTSGGSSSGNKSSSQGGGQKSSGGGGGGGKGKR